MPADSSLRVAVATFRNKTDNHPQSVEMPWPKLAALLTRHSERTAKDGPLWSPTVYRNGGARANENVAAVTAAVGDFDSGRQLKEVMESLTQYEYVIHTTHSHTWEHPKFRVILPLAMPVSADLWPDVRARIDRHVFGLGTDPATKDASRMYYLPSSPPKTPRFAQQHSGELLDPLLLPPVTGTHAPTSTGGSATATRLTESRLPLGKQALDFVANGAPLGEQRMRALAAARNYLSAGYTPQETADAIWRGLQASPQDPARDPWSASDGLQIAADLARRQGPEIEDAQPLAPRCDLRQQGLGYTASYPTLGVEIVLDHLRRTSGELHAEIEVKANVPLVPRRPYWGKLNLSSASARATLVKYLDKRSGGASIPWDDILEETCRLVATSARVGTPFQKVGKLPPDPDLGWAVTDLAPSREAYCIFGAGGSGKSYLNLAIALSIQTGITFVPGFKPLVRGPVLYLDWEANPARLDQRVKLLCAGMEIDPEEIAYRHCQGPLADQAEEILRFAQTNGTIFTIIDSVEMAMSGGGGREGDPNEPVLRLHSALRLIGGTYGLVDHVNRADLRSKGRREAYGGIFKGNLARMVFELRRSEKSPDHTLQLALLNTKRNDDGAILQPIGLDLHFEPGAAKFTRQDTPDEIVVEGHLLDKVCHLLESGKLCFEELAEKTESTTPTKRNSLRKAMNRGAKRGIVEQEPGDVWSLAQLSARQADAMT